MVALWPSIWQHELHAPKRWEWNCCDWVRDVPDLMLMGVVKIHNWLKISHRCVYIHVYRCVVCIGCECLQNSSDFPSRVAVWFSYIMACSSMFLSLWIVMFCSSAGLPYIWLLTMDSCMQSQCYYRGTTASQIWRRRWETCIVLTSRHEMKEVYHSKWGIVNRPNVTTVQWSVALPTYIILCCDVIYKLHCGSKVYTCILCLHSTTGPLSLPLLVKGTRMLWNTW